jgi:hypothetical protein
MTREVRWYFSENGEVKGPLPESELVRLARGGRILPTEYILREGHQEWLSARPLVENAHALPVDGELPTARVATQPNLSIGDDEDGGGGVPPVVWVLVVVGVLALSGFAWYMLGPMSPIMGGDGVDQAPTQQPAPDPAANATPNPETATPPAEPDNTSEPAGDTGEPAAEPDDDESAGDMDDM